MPENDPFSLSKGLYDPALDDFKEESKEVVNLLKSKQQELEFEQTNKLFIEVRNISKKIDIEGEFNYKKFRELDKRLASIESKMDTILERLNGRK